MAEQHSQETRASYGEQRRDAIRRRAIKRQLRRLGCYVLPEFSQNTHALRELRRAVQS